MIQNYIGKELLHFREGQYDDACAMVKRYHYSRRVPSNVQLVGTFHESGGLFGDFGPCCAAVMFSIPPTRWSEDVWELSRLVRRDDCTVPLSRLISLACRHVSAKGMDLLVSFADAQQGHHGGVYQASGWNYAGQRDRTNDGLVVNGTFRPGRSCNSTWGTRSAERLAELHPEWTIEPHYDVGKHLYWRALNRNGIAKALRLGLKSEAYPKPSTALRTDEGSAA